MMFKPGDTVKVIFDEEGPVWYRAEVIGPSTQRTGDYEVRVIEAGPRSTVTAGVRLSPILGHGVEMLIDDGSTRTG